MKTATRKGDTKQPCAKLTCGRIQSSKHKRQRQKLRLFRLSQVHGPWGLEVVSEGVIIIRVLGQVCRRRLERVTERLFGAFAGVPALNNLQKFETTSVNQHLLSLSDWHGCIRLVVVCGKVGMMRVMLPEQGIMVLPVLVS